MITETDLLHLADHCCSNDPLPPLGDLIRRLKNQPTAPGTLQYLSEQPDLQTLAHALVEADNYLKELTEFAAYYIWEKGGCRHGQDQNDWFQAEIELRRKLRLEKLDEHGNKIPA